jgi:fimbrial chaperone protein
MVSTRSRIASARRRIGAALPALAIALSSLGWSTQAAAGQFSVSPVRIFMQSRDRAAAVTVENEGDTPLVMQADIYEWKQGAGGEEELTPSEDMILAPPVIKLGPKARQVVRLALLKPSATTSQRTYRMIVREVPEAAQQQGITLQIAIAFSLPVFITPLGARRQVACTVERASPQAAHVRCENGGNAYAQVTTVQLADGSGATLASARPGNYILPGNRRTFDLQRADGPIPAGKVRVTLTYDDATTQAFDADLAP